MWPVGVTEARLTFVPPPGLKRGGVEVADLLLGLGLEGDHGTVSGGGRVTVESWFDVEIGGDGFLPRYDGQCVAQALRAFLKAVVKCGQDRKKRFARAISSVPTVT